MRLPLAGNYYSNRIKLLSTSCNASGNDTTLTKKTTESKWPATPTYFIVGTAAGTKTATNAGTRELGGL